MVALVLLLKVTVYVHRYEQDAVSGIWTPQGAGLEHGGYADGTGGPLVNIAQQYRLVEGSHGNREFESFHFEVMLSNEQRQQQHNVAEVTKGGKGRGSAGSEGNGSRQCESKDTSLTVLESLQLEEAKRRSLQECLPPNGRGPPHGGTPKPYPKPLL